MEKTAQLVALACVSLALSGCVSMSRSSAEAPVPLDVAREGRVEVVSVDFAPVTQEPAR
jgi:hypothetical protein